MTDMRERLARKKRDVEFLESALREAEAQRDAAKQELAESRADHADEYRTWVKTMDNAVDAERGRAEAAEQEIEEHRQHAQDKHRRAEALEAALETAAVRVHQFAIHYESKRMGHSGDFHNCPAATCAENRRVLAGEPRQDCDHATPYLKHGGPTGNCWCTRCGFSPLDDHRAGYCVQVAEPGREGAER